jgi:phosphopantothenoylcysteine decarboxylase
VVAPLDANTLGKFALGLCDNFLTCLFRAWDLHSKPVVLAPAMNTMMWDSPVTLRHLRQLIDDWGDSPQPARWAPEDAEMVFARHTPRLVLVPPIAKELACGDVGTGAMAEVETIVAEVGRLVGGRQGE